ncbi:hypothetical protein [Ferrimicrobium acidiphilum]|uniref:hypothetical protein n=2 Tax=Ferrimicrobium acidiphilum TaxID=121039 RepID=UPI0023F3BCEA|nr:hypothetical protein [Ferrimicrobium acidiphilum]
MMALAAITTSLSAWIVGLVLIGLGLVYVPLRRMLWKRTSASTVLASYPRDSRHDWVQMLQELGIWWPCAPAPTAFLKAELVRLRMNRVLLWLGVGATAVLMLGVGLIFPVWGSPGSPMFWFMLSGLIAYNVLTGRGRAASYQRHLEVLLADRLGEVLEPPFDPSRDL